MRRSLEIWQFILDQKLLNKAVMLLYVVESAGSSPGRQGFFMAVTEEGLMKGSIGGGVMEHKFVEMAKRRLGEELDERSLRRQVHDAKAAKDKSGMICSGEQTVFIYSVHHNDIAAIQAIVKSLADQHKACLYLSPAGIRFDSVWPDEHMEFRFHGESDWLYREKLGIINQLHVIGGGHCALAFSRVMSTLDFYIHLYEDRASLNTFEENNYVQEKKVLPSYAALADLIPSGDDSYVVVMTFGFRTDDIAVRALIKKNFAYFGLLGSAAKIARLFSTYRKEGIPESLLQKIYAPIGLPISSQTPEEIAISIAAEIIQVKNKKSTTPGIIKNNEALDTGKQ
jgi:xanthine dehydrogenase accessory factor